ncbi:MAG: serine/threonine protein kinase [Planctomycetaceae bacterium]|nr:serine/threonine protein kinase [Planctomycetaceae bacterium]
MTQRQIGPFVIDRQIGVGGMGIVYLATFTETGKKVALKVLPPGIATDPKLLRRFEREIQILKKMDHPNIVKYYGGGTSGGQPWYAMEYIDGGSLRDVLKKKKVLNWEQTIQIGRQLCAALEHAHYAGIIHRDLKPANLFITRKGRLKLGDFGIARDTEATALTAAGKTVGTYAYMAPEQIHGSQPISGKTDLYATGCLLMEVLTGHTPFEGDNPVEMLMQHVDSDARLVNEMPNITGQPTECPAPLEKLIERLLEKNPEDRPYDALAVHTELTEMLQALKNPPRTPHSSTTTGTTAAPGEIPPEQSKKKKKKKKKREYVEFYERTWFLCLSLAGLIAVGTWLMMPPGEGKVFALAEEAWKSSDESTQRTGREKYMLPYLDRFPEGAHRQTVQQWADTIMASRLEAQTRRLDLSNREPRSQYESLFAAALRCEDDSEKNPLEAIELFHSLQVRLETDAKSQDATLKNYADDDTANSAAAKDPRFWLIVTQQHLDSLRTRIVQSESRNDLIRARMTVAEELESEGKSDEARAIQSHFREVFYGTRELDHWLVWCRRRMDGESTEMPPDQG